MKFEIGLEKLLWKILVIQVSKLIIQIVIITKMDPTLILILSIIMVETVDVITVISLV